MAASSLSSLLGQTTLTDHEEVLKAANNALGKSGTDVAAQHTRVVALLKLDRSDDALQALESSGDQLRVRATLEYAYALYRTGRLQDALVAVKAAKPSQALMHLEAQIAYRMEDFARAAELYKQLTSQSTPSDGEESDLRINTGATGAQLAWSGQKHLLEKTQPSREDLEQFETTFNAACGYISRGELKPAELLLSRAKDLCNAADELSEDEKKAELLQIDTQRVFVLSKLGKIEEAHKVCESLDISSIADPATRHIAQVNSLSTNSRSNPYIAQRLFQSTSLLSPRDQPFNFQRGSLLYDSLTLDVQTKKFGGVASASESLSSSAKDSSRAWSGVFTAAAAANNQSGTAALKAISHGLKGESWADAPIIRQHPNDVGLVLTIVQMYALAGDTQHATSLLEDLLLRLEASESSTERDLRFAPGLVAAVTSWYSQIRRRGLAKAELAKAARRWQSASRSGGHRSLLEAAGAAFLESEHEKDLRTARETFAALSKEQSKAPSKTTAAGLVASASSPTQVSAEATSLLPSVEKLTSGIDAAALDSAGVAQAAIRAPTPQKGPKRAAEADVKSSKPNKIRKSRLPKDFDESKKPDPERWLPLRDRSSWRPKGKKKGKGGGGGGGQTQGGAVSEEAPNQGQGPKSAVLGGSGGPSKSSKKKKGKNK